MSDLRWLQLAQLALILSITVFVVLHLLPQPMLHATDGALIPYDPRVNFLSEFVRTQYGSLMTANFVLLGIGAGSGAIAMYRGSMRREAFLLGGVALMLIAIGVQMGINIGAIQPSELGSMLSRMSKVTRMLFGLMEAVSLGLILAAVFVGRGQSGASPPFPNNLK